MNTVTLERNSLRPSNLDRECDWFKSSPAGPAAQRGTGIDDLLRAFFCDEKPFVPEEFQSGFRYAAEKTAEIAGEHQAKIIAAKEDCVIDVPGLPNPATCDCIIRPKFTSIDWKSGQKRDYTKQQACYSLGQMTKNFSLSWTAVCIYYDQGETEWHRFTYREAKEIVDAAIERYASPQAPTPNPLCPWCANFNICPAQRELAGHALTIPEGALDFEAIKADPELLGRFLAGCHALGKYEKEAREAAVEWMFKKRPVPFFSLSKGKRTYSVPPETLILLAKNSLPDLLATVRRLELIITEAGPVSREGYYRVCQQLGVEPDPTHIKEQIGQPFVRFSGKKTPTLENQNAEI